jgi:hypothetical protein
MPMSTLNNLVDWRKHVSGLILLSVCLVLLVSATALRIAEESDREKVQNQLNSLRGQYSDGLDALDVLNASMPQYTKLQEQGVVGMSDRLDWIEELDRIADLIKIPDLQFTLENTRPVQEGETPFYHYEIPIYVSDMYVNVSLLHEGDMYRLFTELEESGSGMFNIEECEIRSNSGATVGALVEGLKAKCLLRWFNLKDITLTWEASDEIF